MWWVKTSQNALKARYKIFDLPHHVGKYIYLRGWAWKTVIGIEIYLLKNHYNSINLLLWLNLKKSVSGKDSSSWNNNEEDDDDYEDDFSDDEINDFEGGRHVIVISRCNKIEKVFNICICFHLCSWFICLSVCLPSCLAANLPSCVKQKTNI